MKIPIYFNYIENTFPDLLEDAVKSITHEKLEVHISRHVKPKPFTHCLNAIQKECLDRGDKYWMFMHYDAEILDNSIIDMIINRYENPKKGEKIASVCACHITDLLILFDTKRIQELGGWNELFNNSYMELDLTARINNSGMTQPIIYLSDCPEQISHKESSSLRNKNKKGSLVKVYSKTYESDMRNYYRIYHPEVNLDNNAALIRWKKYIEDDGTGFHKRDLNIVFSVGKTASTTIYRSWASDTNNLPSVHTHCLNWFMVIDHENSIFMKNMFTNFKHLIYLTCKPSYVPDGCIEVRFSLKGGVTFGQVFSNILFDTVNVVSIVRNPLHRRISQFLNSLTCEGLNSALNSVSNGDKVLNLDPNEGIVEQLKTFRQNFDSPGKCRISKYLTKNAFENDRLVNESELVSLFGDMFIGTIMDEYMWMFNRIKSVMNIDISVDNLRKNGYSIQYGDMNYSSAGLSQKDSDYINVNSMVFKMEKFNDLNVIKIVKDFTGIKSLLHSRDISKEVPIVNVDLVNLKNKLRDSFNIYSLYNNEESLEYKLVKNMGY